MEKQVLFARVSKNGRKQPLQEHLTNAASRMERSCASIGLPTTGRLIGLVHDGGKAPKTWQTYLFCGQDGAKPNHSSAGARFIWEHEKDAKGTRVLLRQWTTAAVCSHHSGLMDVVAPDGRDVLYGRVIPEKEVHYAEAADYLNTLLTKEEWDRLFDEAAAEVERLENKIISAFSKLPTNVACGKETGFAFGLVQRFLESALMDADRYDSYLFETGGEDETPLPPKDWYKNAVSRYCESLRQNAAPLPINERRQSLAEACLKTPLQKGRIYRLDLPTGGGKTVTGGRIMAKFAAETPSVERIFYIAPYKVILEQNAKVFRELYDCGSALLEHHGDAILQDRDADRVGCGVARLLAERWSAPVVLTTFVQFLNTLFLGRSASVRRFHSLASAVILFDEVQSVPYRLIALFNSAINFLTSICGATVILCTATQPDLMHCPIPLLESIPLLDDVSVVFREFRRVAVTDASVRGDLSTEELTQLALDKLDRHGKLLVILNTRRAARTMYKSLGERTKAKLFFLSTDLCPAHRREVVDRLRRMLCEDEPLICVSTALIEAGVDISFPAVIRSLAGMDRIAQCAGRCNRSGEGDLGDVTVIRYGEERLDALKEIKEGRGAAERVLQCWQADPCCFGNDLLSPEAIAAYYKAYYKEGDIGMEYPLSERDGVPKSCTLFKLLGQNDQVWRAMSPQTRGRYQLPQCFETAGRLFEAIEDKGGMDVIVPYGEKGKALVNALLTETDIAVLPKLLREAQSYIVHLYNAVGMTLQREGSLHVVKESGVCLLDERCYDESIGVTLEPGKLDFTYC